MFSFSFSFFRHLCPKKPCSLQEYFAEIKNEADSDSNPLTKLDLSSQRINLDIIGHTADNNLTKALSSLGQHRKTVTHLDISNHGYEVDGLLLSIFRKNLPQLKKITIKNSSSSEWYGFVTALDFCKYIAKGIHIETDLNTDTLLSIHRRIGRYLLDNFSEQEIGGEIYRGIGSLSFFTDEMREVFRKHKIELEGMEEINPEEEPIMETITVCVP